jgi:Domain of unknown function (DUF1906)
LAALRLDSQEKRMKWIGLAGGVVLLLCAANETCAQSEARLQPAKSYLGFDRNDYPGDAALPALRKTFRYSSYWLNHPPGERRNSWAGKREILRRNGFGFLVLFTGRTDAEIKAATLAGKSAEQLGADDGKAAVAAAAREGFSENVLIFLDQEEGGRLLPAQAAYLFAWVDAVLAGGARAGVYCSGIPVAEGDHTITTAENIAERLALAPRPTPKGAQREPVILWIADDRCPPSPGCNMNSPELSVPSFPSADAIAHVWQYAQSPRRAQFSSSCPQNQAPDGKCYAPGNAKIFVDLDAADSADPSEDSY